MTIHFDCTQCGRCCHDLNLPLSVDEAIGWLTRGGTAGLFCEAMPWIGPEPDDPWVRYKGQRAFDGTSGTLPLRILVTIVALQKGACPFLLENQLCGAYDERPRVCRIYPAEIHPLLAMSPDAKLCPPEAWAQGRPALMIGDTVVDDTTAALIEEARAVAVDDVAAKDRLCATLGIDVGALANEGLAVYRPPAGTMLAALRSSRAGPSGGRHWRIASNRGASRRMLADAGALPVSTTSGDSYIGFFPDDEARI